MKRPRGVAPDVNLKDSYIIFETTLALKIGDVTRSSKQVYQWPQNRKICPQKEGKKGKDVVEFLLTLLEAVLCVGEVDVPVPWGSVRGSRHGTVTAPSHLVLLLLICQILHSKILPKKNNNTKINKK